MSPTILSEQGYRFFFFSLEEARMHVHVLRCHAPPPVVEVEIVELQPFRVAALRNHGDYSDLDQVYTRLFQWMAGRGAMDSVTAIWGVPHDDPRGTPPEECIFDCCLATSAELAGDAEVRINRLGGGRYAMYRHTGSYEQLDHLHDPILERILLDADLSLRDLPILHQYLDDPESTPEAALESCIYIPIE